MASLESQVGGLIRHYRQLAGLTQARLAEIVEIQVGSLSRIERGGAAPSFKTLSRLAEALGVEVRDFFEIGDFAARRGRDDALAQIVSLVSSASAADQRRALKTIRAMLTEE